MPAPPQSSEDIASALNVWELIRAWGAPGTLIAAVGIAWRGGRNYSAIRSELTANNVDTEALGKRVAAVELRQDVLGKDHTSLQVAVASLPTRAEFQAGIDSVRAEIRSDRSERNQAN